MNLIMFFAGVIVGIAITLLALFPKGKSLLESYPLIRSGGTARVVKRETPLEIFLKEDGTY